MAASPTDVVLDVPAPDFRLPATDGKIYALKDVAASTRHGHRLHLQPLPLREGGDRPARRRRAPAHARGRRLRRHLLERRHELSGRFLPQNARFRARPRAPFPYLHDETQEAARAYGAVCTPDFFGYDRDLRLKYRGRLDEGRTSAPPPNARRELVEAMRAIAAGGPAPADQIPSIGCSIKWKPGRG